MEGWIKLHRQIVKWEWFQDSKMVHLLVYLIAKANHKERRWQGQVINRGQLVASFASISAGTGMSVRSIRTCMEKLKDSQEVTSQSTSRFTLISICNYDKYQCCGEVSDKPSDKQTTNDRQTTDNKQECKEGEEGKKITDICPHMEIVSLYNSILSGNLAAVKPSLWNGKRKTSLQCRWKEDKERQKIEWWREYFEDVKRSPFLLGQIREKGKTKDPWKADMGWLVNPDNMVKVLEGKYHTKGGNNEDTKERDAEFRKMFGTPEDTGDPF